MKATIFTLCLLAFLCAFSSQSFAVDFTVNLTSDEHDATTADTLCDTDLVTIGFQCSVRAAIEQANALPTDDRVFFSLPNNSTILLTSANGGEIRIENSGALDLIGTGANNLTINGGGANRIFYANALVVGISGMTLTGGRAEVAGGIVAFGLLTLESVHITGNEATNGSGGGVLITLGTLHIINSTISGNIANNACGGFWNLDSTVTVVNSTISDNTALGGGGGFCDAGGMTTLRNVTVTNNNATFGGGIFHSNGALDLGNSIIAGNRVYDTNPTTYSGPEILFNNTGTITSVGGNLVGDSASDSSKTGNNAIAYQSTDRLDMNPLFDGALKNNGGTTPTYALLPTSPAIDAGINALAIDPFDNTKLVFDQRGTGFARIIDGNGDGIATVDIGALEVQQAPTAASVSVSGRVITQSGRSVRNVQITLTDSKGNRRTATSTTFGYYHFDDVEAGTTITLLSRSKSFRFFQPVIVLTVNDQISNADFVTSN